jgi:branched-subunit amino acid transport protein AzlD
MTVEHSLEIILVVAICTMLTRAIPFLVLGGKKEIPQTIKYLGKVLPSGIMAILVVYCLKSIQFMEGSRGIPELLGVLIVISLHMWRRNTLLSIGGGTIGYMILLHIIG